MCGIQKGLQGHHYEDSPFRRPPGRGHFTKAIEIAQETGYKCTPA
jgi:hypothetical protein